jgi:hypothetical protein
MNGAASRLFAARNENGKSRSKSKKQQVPRLAFAAFRGCMRLGMTTTTNKSKSKKQ